MILESSQKWLLIIGALMGFSAVALGAFGAHALKDKLAPDLLSIYEVGVNYHMYHALATFVAVWISLIAPGMLASLSGWLFVGGTLIFSGSLYLLAMTGIRTFGAITPIGGLLFLAGWLCVALAVLVNYTKPQ